MNMDFLMNLLKQNQQPQNGYLSQIMQPQLPQAMPDQGYAFPSAPSNPYAGQQQIDNSGRVIDPFSRGSYYGRVYDPRNQVSGGEANTYGWLRQQNI